MDRSEDPMEPATYIALPALNEDLTKASVIIPQAPAVLVGSNLQHVTFRGLIFAHDNYVLPSGGYGGLNPIPPAVSFQNSQYITFDSSVVRESSGVGLEFISCKKPSSLQPAPSWCIAGSGTTMAPAHNVVTESAFYDLGAERAFASDYRRNKATLIATSRVG